MDNLNEIARLACAMKKPSRIDVYSQLITVIEAGDVNDQFLASIYAFFLPPLAAKKVPEQWVALAMAKNDVRYYLNFVYSDGKRLVATDGHRLHVLKTNQYPPGYYDQQLVKIHGPEYAKYPDIDRVIPKDGKVHQVNLSDLKVRSTSFEGKPVPTVRLPGKVWVERRYLLDTLNGEKDFTVEITTPRNAVRIPITDDRFAVIMSPRK